MLQAIIACIGWMKIASRDKYAAKQAVFSRSMDQILERKVVGAGTYTTSSLSK